MSVWDFSADIRNQFAEKRVRDAINSCFPCGSQILIDGSIVLTVNNNSFNFLYFQDTPDMLCQNNTPIILCESNKTKKPICNTSCSGSGKRKSKKPIRCDYQRIEPCDVYDETGALDLSAKEGNQLENSFFDEQNNQNHLLNYGQLRIEKETNVYQEKITSFPGKKSKSKRRVFSRFHRSNAGANYSARNFTCNQCKESYTSLSALGQHTTQVHQYYRCIICSAQFTQRSNLQRHSLKHVGFKPFVCKLCHKAYYRKDHLMRHLEMSHHNADPQDSIDVKLTYSECLDYIDQYVLNKNENLKNELNDLNKTASSSGSEAVSFKWESPSSNIGIHCETEGKLDLSEMSEQFAN